METPKSLIMMKYSVITFVLLIQLYQIFEDEPSRHLSSFVVVELYGKKFARDIGMSLHTCRKMLQCYIGPRYFEDRAK
jgi:hypothetical protein